MMVRLYLSSHRLGDHPDVFTGLVRGHQRGWVITNVLDGAAPERRCQETRRRIKILGSIGLEGLELDLRSHDVRSLAGAFGEPDFLWVRGGNVFTLRAALARSGADTLITERLHADALVYAGFSAGACVLAPNLSGFEECDPIEEALALYGTVTFEGLGILDRPVVPHLHSPRHPESDVLTRVAVTYSQKNQPYWALRDGQALVVDGNHTALI